MPEHILVYGSLKKHGVNHELLQRHAEYVDTVRLPNYDLFMLGWYPGIRPNPDNEIGVECELYKITDVEGLKALDYYEGYLEDHPEDSLFVRKEVEVNGTPAYVYEYGHTPGEQYLVPSGNWRL